MTESIDDEKMYVDDNQYSDVDTFFVDFFLPANLGIPDIIRKQVGVRG